MLRGGRRASWPLPGRNPEALWFDDYEDRILFDEAGLFDCHRVESQESRELALAST